MEPNTPKNSCYNNIPTAAIERSRNAEVGISLWLTLLFICVFTPVKAQITAQADCPGAYTICDASQSYYFEVNGPGAIDDAYGEIGIFCQSNTSATAFESSSAWFVFTPKYSGEFGFYILPEIEEDWEYILFGSNPDCTDLHNTDYQIICNTDNPNNSIDAYTGIGEHPIQGGGGTIDGFWPYITVNAGEQYILFITPYLVDGGFNHRATLTFQGGLIETHGADAFEQVEACTLGVEGFGLDVVQVYPNPAKDVLHIKAKSNVTAIEIYTLLGQQVLRSFPNNFIETVDMAGFESGMYLVRVFVGEQVQTFKVLKE